MLIFAILCIVYEKTLCKIDQEMFSIPFGGRYMLVVMSICAIYMGFIYNEVASVPLDLFGTAYPQHHDHETEKVIWSAPSLHSASNFTKPYTLGVDPIWRWSSSNVGFTNSLKMKMAIIIGVTHMTMGVVLKAFNMLHFGDKLSFFCESIPELVLFLSIFGYLVILIFLKWGTNWNIGIDCSEHHGLDPTAADFISCAASSNGAGQPRIQYPGGPPALITGLITLAFGGS